MAQVQDRLGKQRDVAQERARVEGQLERLKRLFVLGDLEEEEYRVERDRLRAQLAALTPRCSGWWSRAAPVASRSWSRERSCGVAEGEMTMPNLTKCVRSDERVVR